MNILRSPLPFLLILTLVFASCGHPDEAPNTIQPSHYLSAQTFNHLRVEIQFVNGFRPTSQSMAALDEFLTERVNKLSITYKQKAVDGGRFTYTFDQIATIEKTNRTVLTNGDTLSMYILFIDGDYEGNAEKRLLGAKLSPTSVVVFEPAVQALTGAAVGLPPLHLLETTALLHEVGHLLGLVNSGTQLRSPHQDTKHGSHCTKEDCLMFHSGEFLDTFFDVNGGTVPGLCAFCIEDLRANGGK